MKKFLWLFIMLIASFLVARAAASEMRVTINLSEQKAFLIEGEKVILASPISSGRLGWSTPSGKFRILSKDIDHRSRSFGSVVDASGTVVNGNATPASHVPPGGHFRCAPMPYYMEFSPSVGMHAGYLPGYPASHGCVRMPRDCAAWFYQRVGVGTPVTVVGSTNELTRVRKAMPVIPLRTNSPRIAL